jgi:hypothetical protein
MISQLTPYLARVVIEERERSAQYERTRRRRSYAMPVVREIPRPASRDVAGTSGW